MANERTWLLPEIRTEFRDLTGRSSTNDISDDDVDKLLNDYYVHYFPEDAKVDDLNDFNTFETAVDDNGQYALAQTVGKITDPITANNKPLTFYQDKLLFFDKYPDDEQFVTAPSLAIGSDTTKVANSAFVYDITGNSYNKAAGETVLSGDTVPQNKYGAWSLTIESDGTITVNEAGGNATGYDTPALAVRALDVAGAEEAYMGYVTAVSTDAGGFIPGTTGLDDAAVTDTYTDGNAGNRGIPEAILRYADKLWIKPLPNDIFQIKYPYRKSPVALGETDAPLDVKWGPAIALGAAVLYLATKGEQERVVELTGAPVSVTEFRMASIRRKFNKQKQLRFNDVNF